MCHTRLLYGVAVSFTALSIWMMPSRANAVSEIPIIINILKNSGATEGNAKKAVEEASKILKQLDVKLTTVKVNTLTNNDGDDGSGGGTAGDGNLTVQEGDKVLAAGGMELQKLKNQKGIKITFAKTPDASVPATPGFSVHKNPTAIFKDQGDATKTGQTIAHEIGHMLTLTAGHKVDATTNADAGGHTPNTAGASGNGNIMAPSNRRTGTALTDDQKKEIQSQGVLKNILEKRSKDIEQATPSSPGEKSKQQFGTNHDNLGDQTSGKPPHLDLLETTLSSKLERDTISGLMRLGGLFPNSGTVDAKYRLLFNGDANLGTGIDLDGFLGVDRELQIGVTGNASDAPLSVSGLVIDHTLGGIITPLPAAPLLGIGQKLFDFDLAAIPKEHQLGFDLPKSLLGLTAVDVPVGVVSEDASGIHDTASLIFDLNRWLKDPTLRLFQGLVVPGESVPFEISGLMPNSPFNFFIDEDLLFTGTLGSDGGFVGSFTFPSVPAADFYFLTAQDSSGEFAFNKLHPVPEPSSLLLLGSGLAEVIGFRRHLLGRQTRNCLTKSL